MKGIILHICVICSIACLIIHVLDWYNPYMDFIGHASFVQYMLYFSVIVLAFVEYFCPAKKKH